MGRLRIKPKGRRMRHGYLLTSVDDPPQAAGQFSHTRGVTLLYSRGALVGAGTNAVQLRRLRDLATLASSIVPPRSMLGQVADEVALARAMLARELEVPIELLEPKEEP